jgi:hypothetical protein
MRIDTRAWTTMRTVRDNRNKASRWRQCQQNATERNGIRRIAEATGVPR